jgi:phosphate transport system protein
MMEHTDSSFEADLQRVATLVRDMSRRIEDILAAAQNALRTRSVVGAQQTIEADRDINLTELAIDGVCMQLLALRQPVASDLRFVMTVLKMVTDFERMGDLAKHICERVVELGDGPRLLSDAPLLVMMDDARDMVATVVRAFADRDSATARAVLDSDDRLDDRYEEVLGELLGHMKGHPDTIFEATRLQSIAKYIERIADHATNLAEMVVFLVEAQDIRHSRPAPSPARPR